MAHAIKRMGIREYARHRGVSHPAVRKAIADGRIAAAFDRKSGGIDPELADELWSANTDPTQQRPSAGAPPADTRQGTLFAGGAAEQAAGEEGGGEQRIDYRRAQTLRTVFQTRLLELDYRTKQGELVPVQGVRKEQFELTRRARDRVMQIPERLIGAPKDLVDQVRIECRAAMEELVKMLRGMNGTTD